MGPAFDREAGHLSAHHAAFIAHWLRLLALEETGLSERRSEIWCLHGAHSDAQKQKKINKKQINRQALITQSYQNPHFTEKLKNNSINQPGLPCAYENNQFSFLLKYNLDIHAPVAPD